MPRGPGRGEQNHKTDSVPVDLASRFMPFAGWMLEQKVHRPFAWVKCFHRASCFLILNFRNLLQVFDLTANC